MPPRGSRSGAFPWANTLEVIQKILNDQALILRSFYRSLQSITIERFKGPTKTPQNPFNPGWFVGEKAGYAAGGRGQRRKSARGQGLARASKKKISSNLLPSQIKIFPSNLINPWIHFVFLALNSAHAWVFCRGVFRPIQAFCTNGSLRLSGSWIAALENSESSNVYLSTPCRRLLPACFLSITAVFLG